MKIIVSNYQFIRPLAKTSRKIFSFFFITLLLSVCSYHADAQQWMSFGNSFAPTFDSAFTVSVADITGRLVFSDERIPNKFVN